LVLYTRIVNSEVLEDTLAKSFLHFLKTEAIALSKARLLTTGHDGVTFQTTVILTETIVSYK